MGRVEGWLCPETSEFSKHYRLIELDRCYMMLAASRAADNLGAWPVALSQMNFIDQHRVMNFLHGADPGGVTASLHQCWCKHNAREVPPCSSSMKRQCSSDVLLNQAKRLRSIQLRKSSLNDIEVQFQQKDRKPRSLFYCSLIR